jgi:WD40 repeat protein
VLDGDRTALGPLADALEETGDFQAEAVRRLRDGIPDTVREPEVTFRHEGYQTELALWPDARRAVVAAFGGARVWDLASGEELDCRPTRCGCPTAVAVSPDGSLLAAAGGGGDDSVHLWRGGEPAEFTIMTGGRGRSRKMVFSPDGRILACADWAEVSLWDTGTGRLLRRIRRRLGQVLGVAFAPDGRALASCGADGAVRLWDPSTGEEVRRYKGHRSDVCAVAISPDGRVLGAGGRDAALTVWEFGTARVLWNQAVPITHCLAFSPDGRLLASGSETGHLRLWAAPTGQLACSFRAHEWAVTAVAFTPDGSRLVTAGTDSAARVWLLTALCGAAA